MPTLVPQNKSASHKNIEELATQSLKQLSQNAYYFPQVHEFINHQNLFHKQQQLHKTKKNTTQKTQVLSDITRYQNIAGQNNKRYTASLNQKYIHPFQKVMNISPWAIDQNGYKNHIKEFLNKNCRQASKKSLIKRNNHTSENIQNQQQKITQQKIKTIDRTKKNKSNITRYHHNSSLEQAPNIFTKNKKSDDDNKQNKIFPQIQFVSITRDKVKNQTISNQNYLQQKYCQNQKYAIGRYSLKSYCSRGSLTSNVDKQIKQQGQFLIINHKNTALTQNINSSKPEESQQKMHKFYERYSELKKKNSTNSCEKLKKQIVNNIQKQGLLGIYQPAMQAFKSFTNKTLIKYSKKKQKGYRKRNQEERQTHSIKNQNKTDKINEKQQENSSKNLIKYLNAQKSKPNNYQKQNFPQKSSLYYLQKKTKKIDSKPQIINNPINLHLYEKYKILVSGQN